MVALQKFDFYNNYLNVLRVGLIDKSASQNVFNLPYLSRAYLAIDLESLDDYNDSRLIAATFILRLLSGGRPYISRFGLFQTFHTRTCDLYIQVNINSRLSHNLAENLSGRVFPFLANADFSSNILKKKHGILVGMTIADLSFIRIVETHSVFFRWHDKVRIDLHMAGPETVDTHMLLSAFKF